ncbi:hypothetical protein Enr13x_69490 [Stieleria neptunia]|uniref:Uncharacterized protein n=1 Tax=Stieleria neptunia TaxID=2527979 RepID=A0A518I1P6_9BACT|nr:hypothetical protein Enr13x_69490 [Stieleria neptunia]
MSAGGVSRRVKVSTAATALEGRHSPCCGDAPARTVSAYLACAGSAFEDRALTGPARILSARWAFGIRCDPVRGGGEDGGRGPEVALR